MSDNNIPPSGDMVVGGSNETGIDVTPQGMSSPMSYNDTGQQVPPPPRPKFDSAESSKMTPQILVLLIFAGLKRNWKWALPMAVIMAATAFGALWFIFPIKYEAKAWIQILSAKPHFVFDEKQQRHYDNLVQTQFALIRSPLIIEKALENPEVARLKCVVKEKDKAAWLTKELRLQTQGKSEMITIAIETEEAAAAEKIVNSVVDAFFEYYDNQASVWNTKLITQLTLERGRQESAARMLQEKIRDSLSQAAEAGGGGGADGTMSPGFVPGESLQRDVYLNESKLDAIRAELKMLREAKSDTASQIPESVLANMIAGDPTLNLFQMRKAELEDQIESLKAILVRNDDPRVAELQKRLQDNTEKSDAYMGKIRENKIKEIQQAMGANLEQSIWQKERELRAQEIMVENLRARYQDQVKNTTKRTVDVTDVTFMNEQLKRHNAVLDLLSTRIVSLQTELNAPAQIQLRKKANVPTSPKTEKQLPFALMGAVGCLCFPILLSIAIERIKPRLYHVSQIRRAIPEIMIGEIMEPPVSWVHGANFRKRLARYRESVHNWCTHLLLSDPFRSCRTLAVASVSGDDGKTFLAVQIAVAMAQMKSGPVLLIDGDMRVGRLHLLFGNEETGIGLADILSFRNRIGEAVVLNENEPNLHLLSAGNLDTSPYELLGDGRFRELLDVLEQNYSMILVVVPPVSHAAESLIMSASTETTLLCVRQGETVLAAMEDVYRKLVNTGSFVDGIVVKDIPYYQMAGKDGGFADKLEQIRLSHLLQYSE